MVKIVDKQNIFNHGILSPKLYSRDDLKQFNGGVADAMNFICSRYGPMEKRTGTNFIWDLGNPTEKVFFLPFIFSVKQSVLLEFLANRIRFYTFDGTEFGPIAAPGISWQSAAGRVVYTKKEYDGLEWLDDIYETYELKKVVGTVDGMGTDSTFSTSLHISSSNPALNVATTFAQTFDEEGILKETLTAKKVRASITSSPRGGASDYKIVNGKLYRARFSPFTQVGMNDKWTLVEPNYGICDGYLYHLDENSNVRQIGALGGWTEISHNHNNRYDNYTFGIRAGRLYGIKNGEAVEIGAGISTTGWSSLGSGGYDANTAYHYAICDKKLYAINCATGTPVITQVGSLNNWKQVVDSSDTSNNQPDWAYGIESGKLYALRGTTATKVSDSTTWSALYTGSYVHSTAGRPSIGINNSALYILYGAKAILLDDTGVWTEIYGDLYSQGYGIRDGKLYYLKINSFTGDPKASDVVMTEVTKEGIASWSDLKDQFVKGDNGKFYRLDYADRLTEAVLDELMWFSSHTNSIVDISTDRYKISIEGVVREGDNLQLTYTTTVMNAPYIYMDNNKYYRKAMQYEIETPFSAEQLDDISYVQSLDVVYLAFADRTTPPYTLSRYANNNWKLDLFVTEDGPYLDKNYATGKKMQIADEKTDVSTVNLTGFTLGSNDVGRWIRICTPRYNENTYVYDEKWSYGKIASVGADGKSITVKWSYRNVVNETDKAWMTKATSEWRLGVWHTGTGNKDYPATYPTKVTIHQQRLTWAGLTDKPWIWTSNSFAYKNYAPSDYEGEITDTNAISYDISTDKVSDIFWLRSVKSLLIGTELGELRMYSAGTAITPADVVSNRESSYGSFNAEPVVNDDNIVFIQRLQRTVRSLSYDYNQDSFVGPELTILAEGLTTGGIKKIVFQKEPNNTYWGLKEDGTLLTLTYDKSQDVIGWSKSALAGEDVKVIDLTVLPSNDNGQDMVMFAVERTINGVTKRYLELLSRNFIRDLSQADASFLDCSTHIKSDEPFNVIDGLDFLEGQDVVVMDEGSYLGEFRVTAGRVVLEDDCKDVVVGLPYDAYFETLERDFQDRQLSTKMSKLRVYKLYLYIDRTTGLKLHRLERGSETQLITFSPDTDMDTTGELLTGKVNINVASNWNCDFTLKVNSDPGFPCTVSGIILGVEINAI